MKLTKVQKTRHISEVFFLIGINGMGRAMFKLGHNLLVTAYIKDTEGRNSWSLPDCTHSHWQVHSFTGIWVCFLGILADTEGHLHHPASWNKELLDFWTLQLGPNEAFNIGIVRIQPIRLPNKFYICINLCFSSVLHQLCSREPWFSIFCCCCFETRS